MFTLNRKSRFERELKKLLKKQPELAEQVRSVLTQLQTNPRDPQLKSHKAFDSDGNPVFSVEVTRDIRIAWDYGEPDVIDLLRRCHRLVTHRRPLRHQQNLPVTVPLI